VIIINQKSDVKSKITKVLKEHPEGLTTQNLSDILKLSRNTVIRYASELKGEGKVYIRREGALSLHYLKDLMKKFHKNFEKGLSKVSLLVIFAVISVILPLLTYYGSEMGGMFVGQGEQKSEIHLDFVNLEVNGSREYEWSLNSTCNLESCRTNSIKVSGSIMANASGNASIFIENNGKKYLMVSKDFQLKQIKNETSINETNPTLPIEQNVTLNETGEFANETNQTLNITKSLNETLNETNLTLPIEENITINESFEVQNKTNITLPIEQNVTLNEVTNETEVFYFVDACEETCNITDLFNQTRYKLTFDLSPNISIRLDSFRYVWEWVEPISIITNVSMNATENISTTTTTKNVKIGRAHV